MKLKNRLMKMNFWMQIFCLQIINCYRKCKKLYKISS